MLDTKLNNKGKLYTTKIPRMVYIPSETTKNFLKLPVKRLVVGGFGYFLDGQHFIFVGTSKKTIKLCKELLEYYPNTFKRGGLLNSEVENSVLIAKFDDFIKLLQLITGNYASRDVTALVNSL